MIQEWVEVDLDLFKQIFRRYLSHSGDTEKKVIEVQNIAGIWYDGDDGFDGDCRIFIGSGMDPFEFRESNDMICKLYDKVRDLGLVSKIEEDVKKLNICYFQNGTPIISPMGASKENINIFFLTCFGNQAELMNHAMADKLAMFGRMILWYSRDSRGKIKFNNLRHEVSDFDKMVRIRVMDLDDWKKMIYEGITLMNFPDRYRKGDLKREDIEWGGK